MLIGECSLHIAAFLKTNKMKGIFHHSFLNELLQLSFLAYFGKYSTLLTTNI